MTQPHPNATTQPHPDATTRPSSDAATPPTPPRLTPIELLSLWRSTSSSSPSAWTGDVFEQRLYRFSQALADHYLGCVTTNSATTSPRPLQRHSLSDLHLPTQHYNALRRAGYSYVDQLVGMTTRDLTSLKCLGDVGAARVLNALAAWEGKRRDGAA